MTVFRHNAISRAAPLDLVGRLQMEAAVQARRDWRRTTWARQHLDAAQQSTDGPNTRGPAPRDEGVPEGHRVVSNRDGTTRRERFHGGSPPPDESSPAQGAAWHMERALGPADFGGDADSKLKYPFRDRVPADARDRNGFTLLVRAGWLYSSVTRELFAAQDLEYAVGGDRSHATLPDIFVQPHQSDTLAGGGTFKKLTPYGAGEPVLHSVGFYVDYKFMGCTMFLPGNVYTPKILPEPMTERQRATVFLDNWCSGALVTPTHVLTAAHCVTDGATVWSPSLTTKGNIRSGADLKGMIGVMPGTSIVFKPAFVSGVAGNDIAVMEIAVPFRGDYGLMCLSEWTSDRKLEGLGVKNVGYPRFDSNCGSTDEPARAVNPAFTKAVEPQKQVGTIRRNDADRLLSRDLASIASLSGSPLFHCGPCCCVA